MAKATLEIPATRPDEVRPLEGRIVDVARQLSEAADRLLGSLPRPVRAPIDLTTSLGLPKDIASRLLGALAKRDSLAMLCAMPGAEALYKIGKSARGKVADAETITSWVRAVEEFEAFLSDEVGGKHALDAIASAWLPEARAKFEMANRQTACKSAGNLRGMIAEVGINTCLLMPNPDGETVDRVYISGFVGLRRLRPGLPITVGSRRRQPQIDGTAPASSVAPAKFELPILLKQFCSTPLPSVTITDAGDYSICQMNGEEVGTAAVCDLFLSHYAPGLYPRWATPAGPLTGPSVRLDVPCERMIFDVLLHGDLWSPKEPEMRLYEILLRGPATPNDSSYDPYRLDLLENVRSLGRGIMPCRVAEVVAYQDVLRHVCQARGLDPNSFRSYRCDSQYPVYGVQYYMVFEAPKKLSARGSGE
jgi:hypothetical protein